MHRKLTLYSAIVHKFTRIYPVCSSYKLTKTFHVNLRKKCSIDLKKNNLYFSKILTKKTTSCCWSCLSKCWGSLSKRCSLLGGTKTWRGGGGPKTPAPSEARRSAGAECGLSSEHLRLLTSKLVSQFGLDFAILPLFFALANFSLFTIYHTFYFFFKVRFVFGAELNQLV